MSCDVIFQPFQSPHCNFSPQNTFELLFSSQISTVLAQFLSPTTVNKSARIFSRSFRSCVNLLSLLICWLLLLLSLLIELSSRVRAKLFFFFRVSRLFVAQLKKKNISPREICVSTGDSELRRLTPSRLKIAFIHRLSKYWVITKNVVVNSIPGKIFFLFNFLCLFAFP